MPMIEIQIGDQIIRHDREATAAIYASLKNGWAEDCRCVGCRNLIAQRDVIYPAPFLELLRRLGIDPHKESEAVADGPLENGLHHYGGWFFFVGELIEAGEGIVQVTGSPYFNYFFTPVGPCPKAFLSGPKLAVHFEAHFKWILEESWDSDLRRAAQPRP
jgi:hypothetical protein